MSVELVYDGKIQEYEPVIPSENGGKPTPVPTPLHGFFVYAESGPAYRAARVRHDVVSRTFENRSGLIQTNETRALTGAPDYRSKVVTSLDRNWAWVDLFQSMIGTFMWGLYVQPGYGFQDTNNDPTDPNAGPFKQQSLTCGGNLLSVCSDVIWTNDGAYVTVAIQDFNKIPNFSLTYENSPHLVTKQVIVGHNSEKETYYIAHQKNGDMTFPMACRVPLAIAVRNIEYLPSLPFETEINGWPVTFDAFCFQGSNTFGKSQGDWFAIEEMVVSGIGSCQYDRRVYVRDWIATCPPPVKGWTRTSQTLFEKILRMLRFL